MVVLCVGLYCVVVVFPYHTRFFIPVHTQRAYSALETRRSAHTKAFCAFKQPN